MLDSNALIDAFEAYKNVLKSQDRKASKWYDNTAVGLFNVHSYLAAEGLNTVNSGSKDRGFEMLKMAVEANDLALRYGQNNKRIVWDTATNFYLGRAAQILEQT